MMAVIKNILKEAFRKFNKKELAELHNYGGIWKTVIAAWKIKKCKEYQYLNFRGYEFFLHEFKGQKWLQIRLWDGRDRITKWEWMQEFKNFIFGEEAIVIEVFPRESDLCNKTDSRHLWLIENSCIPNLKIIAKEVD